MMSCVDLINMCLLNAKHFQGERKNKAPQDPSKQDHLSIFQDIFRRADKNDDGKLSFEEFRSYFSDGVLNQEELKKMFTRIDSQQTNNMDTERMCEYFSEYLGEYRNVLTALETLNVTILSAMDKTKTVWETWKIFYDILRTQTPEFSLDLFRCLMILAASSSSVEIHEMRMDFHLLQLTVQDYENSSQVSQFVTRFLLRETISQLHSLQSSLESALESIEGQAAQERQDVKKAEDQRVGHRCNRRTQKSVCLSPTDPYSGILTTGLVVESDHQWSAQINRLEQLIDKLEDSCPRLEPLKEEMSCVHTEKNFLVAQKQLAVNEHHLEQFKQSLKHYTELTRTQSHCLHISAQRLQSGSRYTLYEIWEDQDSWNRILNETMVFRFSDELVQHQLCQFFQKRQNRSVSSKTFQRAIIDCLEGPEQTRTMLLPASWWNLSRD